MDIRFPAGHNAFLSGFKKITMDICTISHTAKQAISALLKHLKQRRVTSDREKQKQGQNTFCAT